MNETGEVRRTGQRAGKAPDRQESGVHRDGVWYGLSRGPGAKVLIARAGRLDDQYHVTTLANRLSDVGFDVLLASLCPARTKGPAGLKDRVATAVIEWAPGRSLKDLASRLRGGMALGRLVRQWRPDILYVVDSWTLPFVLWAQNGHVKPQRGCLVYHTFDWLEPGVHLPVHISLEKAFARRADLVVNTDATKARLQRTLYRLRETPLWVRNVPSRGHEFPAPSQESRETLLGPGSHREKGISLFCPTSCSAERRTKELVHALRSLPESIVLYTFAGNGKYTQECRDLVHCLGLEERVTIAPRVTQTRIEELAASADIGIVLHDPDSTSGNFMANPGRLGLFLALGVPIVATRVPSLRADVYEYGLGACADARHPAEIARAVSAILEADEAGETARMRRRKLFETELNYEVTSAPLVEKLWHLMEAKQRCAES